MKRDRAPKARAVVRAVADSAVAEGAAAVAVDSAAVAVAVTDSAVVEAEGARVVDSADPRVDSAAAEAAEGVTANARNSRR